MAARRARARRGSGSIQLRAGRLLARISLGTDAFHNVYGLVTTRTGRRSTSAT
jgi:hypothetical protein